MNTKIKNVLNVLLDILIVLVMVFSILVLVIALTQKTDGVSHLFGYAVRSVQTTSMEVYNEDGTLADGSIKKGDLIILKMSDAESYEIGDTVMFQMPIVYDGSSYVEGDFAGYYEDTILVTHSIIGISEEVGVTYYETKGTANVLPDINLKRADQIIAVYTGVRLGGIGNAIDFINEPLGFLLCVVLPILVFVIIQAIRVIKNFIAYKAQKLATEGTPSTGELSEEEKRRIAEEYMRQLASQNAQPSTGEAPAEGE